MFRHFFSSTTTKLPPFMPKNLQTNNEYSPGSSMFPAKCIQSNKFVECYKLISVDTEVALFIYLFVSIFFRVSDFVSWQLNCKEKKRLSWHLKANCLKKLAVLGVIDRATAAQTAVVNLWLVSWWAPFTVLYIKNEWHAICSDVPSNNNNTPALPADTGEAVITRRRKKNMCAGILEQCVEDRILRKKFIWQLASHTGKKTSVQSF